MNRAGTAAALIAAGVLTGCGTGGEPETAPTVRVESGAQDLTVDPSQYCLSGEGRRYSSSPPIIEVSPDTTITLTVAEVVAEQGWSVQVYDDRLQELIGEVDVPDGTIRFDGINSSDAAPAAFYLVVVEDSVDGQCSGLSGAWPIGFIRS